MEINLLNYTKNKVIDIEIDLDNLNETYKNSTVSKFNKISGTITIEPVKDIYLLKFSIETNLTLLSSLSLKEFNKDLNINEELFVTTNKDLESEETMFTSNSLDIDNLIYSFIITNLPIKLYAPNEESINNEDYRVIKEEDLIKEKDNSNNPFDILKDLDLDK
ncbi:MAG: DUF177 domain-containing protein [Firmicutes bacterium]|uniref:DUF177 domain-containing protein n=1 Tax=Candidatus Onthovivens merdipullorum TaxID=2840889 RepID=A0A9D9GWX9_9BACL|nr:DUF177 domain-containing protein [Candidatus Onthovivens merdipullorum]